jgi:hypothetical protein
VRRPGRRAERAKREALPCKNDALRRSGRLERRWRQTVYDRRDASLSVGDTFEQDSELYRVLAIQTGHGPFDYVVEVEWLTNVGPSDFEPALVLGQRRSAVLRACVRSSTAPRGLGRTAHRHRRFEHIRTPLEWLRCGESHSGVGPKRRVHGSCGISGAHLAPLLRAYRGPGLKRRREGPGEPNPKHASYPPAKC